MWLEGSTVITPTVCSRARRRVQSAATRLDLPTPGGPVMPSVRAHARVRVEQLEQALRPGMLVLGQRDRPRHRAPVARQDARGERVGILLASP